MSDDRMLQAIAEFTATDYYKRPFHRDNPALAPLVDAYLAGDTRPTDTQLGANHYARGLVLLEDVRRATAPTAPGFTGWDARPSFSPLRTVVCTTTGQFLAAWAAVSPGDLLDVRGVTFTGQVNLIDRQLPGWAEVHFDDGCRFLGGGGRLLNAAWVARVRNVRLYGGDLSNPTGHGIRLEDFDGSWWGFHSHDVGGSCVQAFAITRDCTMDVRGEVSRNGGDLTMDPHAEKGTGLHGFYVADSGSHTTRGTFIVRAHDLPAGHALECGYNADITVEVDARRLTKVATSQVAGSALCVWGDNANVRADYLYGEDLAGRMVEPDALGRSTVAVEYARASGTRLAPYPAHAGVTYGDVA